METSTILLLLVIGIAVELLVICRRKDKPAEEED